MRNSTRLTKLVLTMLVLLCSSYWAFADHDLGGTWLAVDQKGNDHEMGMRYVLMRFGSEGRFSSEKCFHNDPNELQWIITHGAYELNGDTLTISEPRRRPVTAKVIWEEGGNEMSLEPVPRESAAIKVSFKRSKREIGEQLYSDCGSWQPASEASPLEFFLNLERGTTVDGVHDECSDKVVPLPKSDSKTSSYRAFSIPEFTLGGIPCEGFLIFERQGGLYRRLLARPTEEASDKTTGRKMYPRLCAAISAAYGRCSQAKQTVAEDGEVPFITNRNVWFLDKGKLSIEIVGQEEASGSVSITFEPVENW